MTADLVPLTASDGVCASGLLRALIEGDDEAYAHALAVMIAEHDPARVAGLAVAWSVAMMRWAEVDLDLFLQAVDEMTDENRAAAWWEETPWLET